MRKLFTCAVLLLTVLAFGCMDNEVHVHVVPWDMDGNGIPDILEETND